jgi:sigma-E factor negative regulatory protein RseA
MNDSVKEQLSACLDGELPEAELDLLLKRIGRDAEVRQTLGRYALASEALKVDKPAGASGAFAANVMAALENEPAAVRSGWRLSPAMTRRLRPVAGFAVAASVAAIAVFSVQRAGIEPGAIADRDLRPAQTLVQTAPEPSYTVPTTTSTSAFVPATRLTNYVVAHSEYSSPLGRRTVLSGVLSEDDVVPDEPAADAAEPQVTQP